LSFKLIRALNIKFNLWILGNSKLRIALNDERTGHFRNAEAMAKLNSQIDEQQSRRETAEAASRRMRELQNQISSTLYKLLEKLQVRVIEYDKFDKRRAERRKKKNRRMFLSKEIIKFLN